MLTLIWTMTNEPDDRAFLEQLYLEHYRLMYWVAAKSITDPQDRSDVVHDSLVHLIPQVKKLRSMPPAALTGYITVTVRNTAYNLLRQQRRQREHLPLVCPDPREQDQTFDRLIHQWEDQELLLALAQRMTEDERILLEGKFLLHLSDEELAKQLGCKVESLRTKLHRTRCNLRKYQQEIEGGAENVSDK